MSTKLIVNQPNAIIISIYNVLSPYKLHMKNFEIFFEKNLNSYMKKNSEDKRIIRLIQRVKKEECIEAAQQNKKSIFSESNSKENDIDKTAEYILTKSKQKNDNPSSYTPVSLAKDWLWADNLESGDLKSTVYDFVPELLNQWRMKFFIKLFSISEAEACGQRLFFKSTQFGDLTKYFNNYIQFLKDNRSNKDFYKSISNLLRDAPINLLYITDEINDGLAAHQAGLDCIIIGKDVNDIKSKHNEIKFTNSIENIEFKIDPNRTPDCC